MKYININISEHNRVLVVIRTKNLLKLFSTSPPFHLVHHPLLQQVCPNLLHLCSNVAVDFVNVV